MQGVINILNRVVNNPGSLEDSDFKKELPFFTKSSIVSRNK